MDIVGSFGYAGQPLVYLDADKFCYISGSGIIIIDPSGPKDIIWRHEHGISEIASHILQKWLAIAPKVSGLGVEMMDIGLQKVVFTLKNPTNAHFIHLSFSKDASRLIGLSDVCDQNVVLWNVDDRVVLLKFHLNDSYSKCAFNPANSSFILLSNSETIATGTYSEILGIYELKIVKYDLVVSADQADEEDKKALLVNDPEVQPISYTNPVGFICWASLETLFIGSTQGYFFELNTTTRCSTIFGNNHNQRGDFSPPCCAILTSEFLIVGAKDGTSKWFPKKLIEAILPTSDGNRTIDISHFRPSRIVKLQMNKTPLEGLHQFAVNPLYTSVAAGSLDGTIHLMDVELEEDSRPEEEEGREVVEDPVAALLNSFPVVSEITLLEPFVNLQSGAILCARSLYLQVMQTQDGVPINEFSGTLSLLITGAHTGNLMFWRTPVPAEVDVAFNGVGVRKSTPRMPQVMSRYGVSNGAAVVQIEVMSAVCKHGGKLLAIGTSDGWLELALVEAFESEDEDGAGDDEEGLFYLRVTRIFRRRIFATAPVSIISTCESKPLVAISSHFDDTVHIIAFSSVLGLANIVNSFSIQKLSSEFEVWTPMSLLWQKNNLCIVTDRGFFIILSNLSDRVTPEAPLPINFSISSSNFRSIAACYGGSSGLFLISGEIGRRVLMSSRLPAADDADPFSSFVDHTAAVTCLARSLHGTLLATGCMDGTVSIWSLATQGGTFETTYLNAFRIHNSAVITLEFSIESSLLLSAAADGSVFIINVDKMQTLKKDPRASACKLNDDVVKDTILQDRRSTPSESLWIDIHNASTTVALRDKFADSINNVKESLDDLKRRLEEMLLQNDKCDEMEAMESTEFVVDTTGGEARKCEKQSAALLVKKRYEDDCLKNELIAARIRLACWDSNEVHARCILPFQGASSSYPSGVWSFPIKKYSDADILNLDRSICVLFNRMSLH